MALIGVFALSWLTTYKPDVEQSVELAWLYDMRGPVAAPDDIVVIGMDDKSENELQLSADSDSIDWRTWHPRVIRQLEEAGARVIVFDISLEEASDPGIDEALATSVSAAGSVILLSSVSRNTSPDAEDGTSPSYWITEDIHTTPAPIFKEAALGHAPFLLPRGVPRIDSTSLFAQIAGGTAQQPVLAFALASAAAFETFVALVQEVSPGTLADIPQTMAALRSERRVQETIQNINERLRADPRLGEALRERAGQPMPDVSAEVAIRVRSLIDLFTGPTERWINFYGPPGSFPYYSYVDALNRPDLLDVAGKTVLIGFAADNQMGVFDEFPTVVTGNTGEQLKGIEIAATVIANLQQSNWIQRVSIPTTLLILLAWGLLAGIVTSVVRSTVASVLVGCGLIVGYLVTASQAYAVSSLWMPILIPVAIQVPAALLGAGLLRYVQLRAQKGRMQEALRLYLPDNLVQQAESRGIDIKGEFAVLDGTCLATDVHAYTRLAESLPADELTDIMNEYFAILIRAVKTQGGIVADVTGDSMIAIWPDEESDDSSHESGRNKSYGSACRAALSIAEQVNRTRAGAHRSLLPTRLGLHTGRVRIGTVGAEDHYEWRATGDMVNSASRIQELNKQLGTRLLISEETAATEEQLALRPMGRFVLFGKSKSIQVYELLGMQATAPENWRVRRDRFETALRYFRNRQWSEAEAQFSAYIDEFGEDGPSGFYLTRCISFHREEPPPDWDGSIHLQTK